MDLKNYAKKRNGAGEPPRTAPENDDLRRQTEELSKKSRPELMDQLMEEIQKGKTDGSFNEDALSSFAERLSPMLNDAQKKRLAALTEQLKGQF